MKPESLRYKLARARIACRVTDLAWEMAVATAKANSVRANPLNELFPGSASIELQVHTDAAVVAARDARLAKYDEFDLVEAEVNAAWDERIVAQNTILLRIADVLAGHLGKS